MTAINAPIDTERGDRIEVAVFTLSGSPVIAVDMREEWGRVEGYVSVNLSASEARRLSAILAALANEIDPPASTDPEVIEAMARAIRDNTRKGNP